MGWLQGWLDICEVGRGVADHLRRGATGGSLYLRGVRYVAGFLCDVGREVTEYLRGEPRGGWTWCEGWPGNCVEAGRWLPGGRLEICDDL